MKVLLLGVLFLAVGTMTAASRTLLDELIARAKSLELDTPYEPMGPALRVFGVASQAAEFGCKDLIAETDWHTFIFWGWLTSQRF